LKQCKFTTYY